MKVYYAHCMAIYDTPQEQRDISLLQKMGFQVVNPNTAKVRKELDKIKNRKEAAPFDVMAYFEKFANECDAVAFRGLPGGAIPGGVALELDWFKERNKPILELPTFALRTRLDKDETRLYLAEVGER